MSESLRNSWYFDGKIVYVKEGHVYDVVLDLGFNLSLRVTLTVDGINLPSLRASNKVEREFAQRAKDFAMSTFLNKKCLVETFRSMGARGFMSNIFFAEDGEEKHTTLIEGRKFVDAVKVLRSAHDAEFKNS